MFSYNCINKKLRSAVLSFKYVLREPNPKTKPPKYQPARLKDAHAAKTCGNIIHFRVFIHQKWPENLPGFILFLFFVLENPTRKLT